MNKQLAIALISLLKKAASSTENRKIQEYAAMLAGEIMRETRNG